MTKLIRTKDSPPIIPFVGRITKKLGNDTGRIGTFHAGNYQYGSDNEIGFDLHGVYQTRKCIEGKIPVKMRFRKNYKRTYTPALIAHFAKFKSGSIAWKALTDEQRAVYNEKAKIKKVYGYNLFIKEFMKS